MNPPLITSASLSSILDAQDSWRISTSALRIMLLTHSSKHPLRPAELAARLNITDSAVSGIAKTLVARRILRKQRHDPADERIVQYTLLSDGVHILESILAGKKNPASLTTATTAAAP